MTDKSHINCDLCHKEYIYGGNQYDGRFVKSYNANICRTCDQANWDGFAPQFEKTLLSLIEKAGLPIPERNSKGWLPNK